MRHIQRNRNNRSSKIHVGLDRVQFRARAWEVDVLSELGFQRIGSRLVRKQTPIATYTRVDTFVNPQLNIQAFVQRNPACPWLWPFKITVIPDDNRGLLRADLDSLVRAFSAVQFVTVELAIDFTKESGVDEKFILRHGLFGKSRPAELQSDNASRFGSRHSPSHVRAYKKAVIDAYRVEPELRRVWLNQHGIRNVWDFASLVQLIVPAKVKFVRVYWPAVARYLSAKSISPDLIIREAKTKEASIYETLRYLRNAVGIANAHRFLRLLPVNQAIQEALELWAAQWLRSEEGEK